MKKILILLFVLIVASQTTYAQKYFTRAGQVSFHSRAMLEDIDAYNNQGTLVMDVSSGKIQMAILIKSFQFEKALMQEHFNENYMESDEYPKANFSGKIESTDIPDLSKDGQYSNVKLSGELTIRDITKPINTLADFNVKNGLISASTNFKVKVSDYDISIPSIVKDKIAREVEIKVDVKLSPM